MNNIEAKIQAKYPILTRIQEGTGKAPIEVQITKRHYPDFKIFYPEYGAGLWLEVKGYVRDKQFRPMLAAMPADIRQFYCVITFETNVKRRESLIKFCNKYNIKVAHGQLPIEWVLLATDLYSDYTKSTTNADK